MDITKSREEFEKWANRLPSISITGRLERCGENYVDDYHTVFWLAWKASRDSIEVDLDHLGYIQVEEDVFYPDLDAIRHLLVSSGIRIKGEGE
ncbi:hypothetical protein BF17_16595 [Yersinia similis]|uniref:Phage protein n=2 Tax=Yersinia similis TaxID=367190 RepID=A0ABN4CVV8_9GAMM|nr:hypothetical protein [Yersinia similis]AHK21992.1 hypothetical protein BF17_16595 [Yersinia similis]